MLSLHDWERDKVICSYSPIKHHPGGPSHYKKARKEIKVMQHGKE